MRPSVAGEVGGFAMPRHPKLRLDARPVGASDRDFGLYIFRYTGPGAAAAPECDDVSVSTAVGTAVTVPLTCTDANNDVLTLSIVSGPANGTLGAINQSQGSVTYTPRAGFRRGNASRRAARRR